MGMTGLVIKLAYICLAIQANTRHKAIVGSMLVHRRRGYLVGLVHKDLSFQMGPRPDLRLIDASSSVIVGPIKITNYIALPKSKYY